MQQQFEYKPFDRVTFCLNGENLKGVYYASRLSESKGIAGGCYLLQTEGIDGLMPITAPYQSIRPGHYDADGNWLPQPGEPCHVLLSNGNIKKMVVVSAEEYRVTAIGEYDTEKTVYFKRALGFVDADFDIDECGDIPQSAILYLGRIKTAE